MSKSFIRKELALSQALKDQKTSESTRGVIVVGPIAGMGLGRAKLIEALMQAEERRKSGE